MLEEEWGFFIDLELYPSQKEIDAEKQIQKQKQIQKRKQIQIQKQKLEKNIVDNNCLSIIYEDEIWYKRDDEDDTDYKDKPQEYSEGKKKEPETTPKTETETKPENKKNIAFAGYINKTSAIIYCIICASFISWSFLV